MLYPFINETAAYTRRFSRAATRSPNSFCFQLGRLLRAEPFRVLLAEHTHKPSSIHAVVVSAASSKKAQASRPGRVWLFMFSPSFRPRSRRTWQSAGYECPFGLYILIVT